MSSVALEDRSSVFAAGIEVPLMRPDFLVVGAQKAGTSTLHAWLAALPGMRLPRDKETHYLTHPERSALGARWYEAQFPAPTSAEGRGLVGEVDPELLHHPDGASRVRAIFGAPRIVVILREPLARARSQHGMSAARGLEALAFGAALEAEAGRLDGAALDSESARHHCYLERSRYARDIARYQGEFGREAVLLLRFEDLFEPVNEQARLEVFGELLRFIGYGGPLRIDNPSETRNGSWRPRSRVMAHFLHGGGGLRRLLGRVVPSRGLRRRIGLLLDAWNQTSTGVGGQHTALDAHWQAEFLLEVDRVEALTGWDCGAWKAAIDSAAQTSKVEGSK